jgi:hypothetical protein
MVWAKAGDHASRTKATNGRGVGVIRSLVAPAVLPDERVGLVGRQFAASRRRRVHHADSSR